MQDKAILIRGWIQACFSVLVLWGLNNVMIGYSAQVLDANYLVYTCSAFVSCSLFLLLVGGRGPLVKETLRSVDTWAFGLIMLLGYLLTLSLFSYVTSTEGSLLQRISLIFGVIISWVFLSRPPSKGQFLGILVVGIGLYMICRDIPEDYRGMVYLLMFLEGLALTGRMFVAEIHRPHKQAMSTSSDPRAKARVVGFVMFIISTFFLTLTGLLAILQTYAPLPVESSIIPTVESFQHSPSIFAGLVAGVFLLAPLRLIEFSSANIIKSENFLALAALSSIATLFWEWLLQPLTGMTLKSLSQNDLIALAIITLGCLVAAISKARESGKTPKWQEELFYAGQDPQVVEDSREILANTLEHYDSDFTKSAKALSVHVETIEALIDDKKKVLAFKPEILKEVARAYRKKVAMSDALTGLANRAGFMTTLKGAPYEADQFALLYIDLDKFKPVNDTYGHEAGDAVLKAVADRMTEMFPFRALPTRLGGDEFAVLVLDADRAKAEELAKELKAKVIEPIDFNGQEIAVGASVGIACFPEDGTEGEALLKIADGGMYAEKGEGGSSR